VRINTMINILLRVKRVSPTAILPKQQTAGAAGIDLCADLPEDVVINPHETVMISSGLAFEIPAGYFGAIYARSGLSTKRGLRPANCVGVIDSDYRGPVGLPLHNDTDEVRVVKPGDRVAQMVIQEAFGVILEEVEELSETKRGSGGFGSTGR
jgi:dUTP pyrophosphatase